MIIGAASVIPQARPTFYEMYQNNESLTPTQRCPLEEYTLYIVDMHEGRLTDHYDYKVDKIFLSHNQGLYLYNHTLSVLSVQHQAINIFSVEGGRFTLLRTVGRFCCGETMPTTFVRMPNGATVLAEERPPFREITINSLKHRLLVFLFRQAKASGDKLTLRRFFQYFDQYRLLRMWKMQLLDDNHLLIKYASEDVVTMKHSEPGSQPSFFVIYHIWDTQILSVFDNASPELLYLFEHYCDHFRNTQVNSNSNSIKRTRKLID